MKQLINILVISFILITTMFILTENTLAICPSTGSQASNLALEGATEAGTSCSGRNLTNPNGTVATAVNILSYISGAIVVFMVIFAGFIYVTSGGDSAKLKSARSTLINAIIGIVIIVTAQLIVHFIINSATGL